MYIGKSIRRIYTSNNTTHIYPWKAGFTLEKVGLKLTVAK